MKKLINLAALSLLLSVFSLSAFAQTTDAPGKTLNPNSNLNQYRVNWVDADGDGICDNFGTVNQGQGNGYGKFNKNGNQGMRGRFGDGSGIRPQDGTGFGRGNGTGACDGTGPKGKMNRGGKGK